MICFGKIAMRRFFRPYSVPMTLFVIVLNLCGSSLAQTVDADWPSWRGPRGDGSWNAPRLAENWPKDGLASEWFVEIGGGYAGISVAGDRAITMDRQVIEDTDQVAQDDVTKSARVESERVLCFDLQTGKELWTFEYEQTYGDLDYGNGPRAAPTIHGDIVLTLGALGKLNCLNVADGSETLG